MFTDDGFLILPGIISVERCRDLTTAIDSWFTAGAGTRGMLSRPGIAALARELRTSPAIAPHLPGDAVAIQCTYFRKDATTNWFVPWHQDTSLPCRKGIGSLDPDRWSIKEGEDFVEPPSDVLESVVAVRLALDDNTPENGPLRVRPGTHHRGLLTEAALATLDTPSVDCCVAAGGAILMKPLLVHSSGRVRGTAPRRVLHFLYGPPRPPRELEWNISVA